MSIDKTLSIPGLVNGTPYNVRIKAVKTDTTALVSGIQQGTPAVVPTAPKIIQVLGLDKSLAIYFSPPQYDGGLPVTNYSYSLDDGVTYTTPSPGSSTSPLVVRNLINGTNYTVRIKAINLVGAGEASEAIVSFPSRTPDTPAITGISVASSTSISLSFTATQPQGVAPTQYYQYSLDNGTTYLSLGTEALTSPLTIGGLSSGATYNVKLRAVNSAGFSTASATKQVMVAPAPGKPTITAVTRGDRQLSLALTAPGSSDRPPVINYEYSLDGGVTWAARLPASAASPLVITGLTNGVTYSVKVRGVSLSGSGEASDSTAPVKVFAAPAQPVITEARGVNGAIRVKFSVEDNGSPITNVSYATAINGTPSSYTTFSPATGDVRQIVIPNLNNTSVYNVRIKAINAVGPSPESVTVVGVTPRGVPDAPTNVSFTTTTEKINVTLSLPANNGYPITSIGYFLYRPEITTSGISTLDTSPYKTLLYNDSNGDGYLEKYEGYISAPEYRSPSAFFRDVRGIAYSSLTKKLYFTDIYTGVVVSTGANLNFQQLSTFFGVVEEFNQNYNAPSTTKLALPRALSADASGNVYVLDRLTAYPQGYFTEYSDYQVIKKITSTGTATNPLSTTANGSSYGADGSVSYISPGNYQPDAGVRADISHIACASDGKIYLIEPVIRYEGYTQLFPSRHFFIGVDKPEPSSENILGALIRRFDPATGYIDTVAGWFMSEPGYKDGIDRKSYPYAASIAYDPGTDPEAYAISQGYGRRIRFRNPKALTVDNNGNIYVADTFNHAIRKIAPYTSVYAGSCVGTTSGTTLTVTSVPAGTSAIRVGTVIHAVKSGSTLVPLQSTVRVTALNTGVGGVGTYTLSGSVVSTTTTVWDAIYFGSESAAFAIGNISGTSMTLTSMVKGGLWLDTTILPVAGAITNRITSYSSTELHSGIYTTSTYTLASSQSPALTDVPIFMADTTCTTLAGLGEIPGIADGTGSDARFNYPAGICIDDATGNLYVADTYNHTIRRVTPAGVVTTIAGVAGFPGYLDGTGTGAKFYYPAQMTYAEGNLYLLHEDLSSYRAHVNVVRQINVTTGVVSTVAGTPYYRGQLYNNDTTPGADISQRYNLGLNLSATTATFDIPLWFPSGYTLNSDSPFLSYSDYYLPSGASLALKLVAYNSAGIGDASVSRVVTLVGPPSDVVEASLAKSGETLNFTIIFKDMGGSDISSIRCNIYSDAALTTAYGDSPRIFKETPGAGEYQLTYTAAQSKVEFSIDTSSFATQSYYLVFYASNSSGESQKLQFFNTGSGAQTFSYQVKVIRAPSGLSISSVTPIEFGKLRVAYALTSNGGEAVLNYKLNAGDYVTASYAVASGAGTFDIEGLTSGESYVVGLQVINEASAITATTTAVALITKPKAPQLTIASVEDRTITVQIAADSETGGSPVKEYTLNIKNVTTNTTTQKTLESTAKVYTLNGLINGNTYELKLSTTNVALKTSDFSSAVTATPVGLPLNAPTIVNINEYVTSNPLGGTVRVAFSYLEADLNGSAFAGVEYSLDEGITWNRKYLNQLYLDPAVSGTSFNIFSLAVGRSYSVILRLVNSVGSGTKYSAATTFIPGKLPGSATLTYGDFTFGGDQQIPVFLTPPENTGGHPLTAYRLFRPDNSGTYDLSGAYETYSPTSPLIIESTPQNPIDNGTYYNYYIQTVNKFGGGGFVYVLALAQAGSLPPSAPTIDSVVSGNLGKLIVNFTAGTSGSPVLFYQYQTDGLTWTSVEVPNASFIGTIANSQGNVAGNILTITEITGDNGAVALNDVVDSVSGAYIVNYVSPLGGTEISFTGSIANNYLTVSELQLGSNNIELDMAIDRKLAAGKEILPGTIITQYNPVTCQGRIDNGTVGQAGTVFTVTSGLVVRNSLITGTGVTAGTTVGSQFAAETFQASLRGSMLLVPSTVTRRFRAGEFITGSGVPENTQILSDTFEGTILNNKLTVKAMPFLAYGNSFLQVNKFVAGPAAVPPATASVLEDTKITGYDSISFKADISPSAGSAAARLKVKAVEPILLYKDQIIVGEAIPETTYIYTEKYTGTITNGNIFTVTSVDGFIEPGKYLSGSNLPAGTQISKFLNGVNGGLGQYELKYDTAQPNTFSLPSQTYQVSLMANPTTVFLAATEGAVIPAKIDVTVSTAIGGAGEYTVDKTHSTEVVATYTTGGIGATRYKLSKSANLSERTITTAYGGPGIYAVNISQQVSNTTISSAPGKAGTYVLNKAQNIPSQTFKSTLGGVGIYTVDKNLLKSGAVSVKRPIIIGNLTPDQQYDVTIRAVSRYGASADSNTVTATARAGVSAPSLSLNNATGSDVVLDILVPAIPPANRPLLLNYVYSTDGGNTYRDVEKSTSTQLFLARVLRGQTTYVLVAGRNIDGIGNWSSPITVTTAASAPSIPADLSYESLVAEAIDIIFTPALDNGSSVTSYQAAVVPAWDTNPSYSTVTVIDHPTLAGKKVFTVSGFDPGKNYTAYIRAINSTGTGPALYGPVKALGQPIAPDFFVYNAPGYGPDNTRKGIVSELRPRLEYKVAPTVIERGGADYVAYQLQITAYGVTSSWYTVEPLGQSESNPGFLYTYIPKEALAEVGGGIITLNDNEPYDIVLQAINSAGFISDPSVTKQFYLNGVPQPITGNLVSRNNKQYSLEQIAIPGGLDPTAYTFSLDRVTVYGPWNSLQEAREAIIARLKLSLTVPKGVVVGINRTNPVGVQEYVVRSEITETPTLLRTSKTIELTSWFQIISTTWYPSSTQQFPSNARVLAVSNGYLLLNGYQMTAPVESPRKFTAYLKELGLWQIEGIDIEGYYHPELKYVVTEGVEKSYNVNFTPLDVPYIDYLHLHGFQYSVGNPGELYFGNAWTPTQLYLSQDMWKQNYASVFNSSIYKVYSGSAQGIGPVNTVYPIDDPYYLVPENQVWLRRFRYYGDQNLPTAMYVDHMQAFIALQKPVLWRFSYTYAPVGLSSLFISYTPDFGYASVQPGVSLLRYHRAVLGVLYKDTAALRDGVLKAYAPQAAANNPLAFSEFKTNNSNVVLGILSQNLNNDPNAAYTLADTRTNIAAYFDAAARSESWTQIQAYVRVVSRTPGLETERENTLDYDDADNLTLVAGDILEGNPLYIANTPGVPQQVYVSYPDIVADSKGTLTLSGGLTCAWELVNTVKRLRVNIPYTIPMPDAGPEVTEIEVLRRPVKTTQDPTSWFTVRLDSTGSSGHTYNADNYTKTPGGVISVYAPDTAPVKNAAGTTDYEVFIRRKNSVGWSARSETSYIFDIRVATLSSASSSSITTAINNAVDYTSILHIIKIPKTA
jgi:hypothetical protein